MAFCFLDVPFKPIHWILEHIFKAGKIHKAFPTRLQGRIFKLYIKHDIVELISLVGGFSPPLWKRLEFVNWDDYSQYDSWENKSQWQPFTTNQSYHLVWYDCDQTWCISQIQKWAFFENPKNLSWSIWNTGWVGWVFLILGSVESPRCWLVESPTHQPTIRCSVISTHIFIGLMVLLGWWFQHLWNIWVSWDAYPN